MAISVRSSLSSERRFVSPRAPVLDMMRFVCERNANCCRPHRTRDHRCCQVIFSTPSGLSALTVSVRLTILSVIEWRAEVSRGEYLSSYIRRAECEQPENVTVTVSFLKGSFQHGFPSTIRFCLTAGNWNWTGTTNCLTDGFLGWLNALSSAFRALVAATGICSHWMGYTPQ